MPQWNATLSGAGYVFPADSVNQSNVMTGSGQVTQQGTFYAAKVLEVIGGSAPAIQIRHGKDPSASMIRSVGATNGAEIDRRSAPDAMPNGIFLTVTGNPSRIVVDVQFR